MNKRIYARNWCDYLTPCPYNPDIRMGSYECVEQCPFHVKEGDSEEKFQHFGNKNEDLESIAKYFEVIRGTVGCSHE